MLISNDLIADVSNMIIDIPYPIDSEEQILQLYETTFQENPSIKVAVIGILYTFVSHCVSSDHIMHIMYVFEKNEVNINQLMIHKGIML